VKRKKFVLEKVLVTGYAAEGKSLAKIDGKIIFIEGAVPGDMVDVFVSTNKKEWGEGRATHFHELSKERAVPFCRHFGTCGGCKWQMLPYEKQLQYKQQEVAQNFKRIGKIPLPDMLPIVGADATTHYRNKLEFTFSNKRYLTSEEIRSLPQPLQKEEASPNPSKGGASVPADARAFSDNQAATLTEINEASPNPSKGGASAPVNSKSFRNHEQLDPTIKKEPINSQAPKVSPFGGDLEGASPSGFGGEGALGFHVPRIFDKVIDIRECYLMDDVNNQIRNNIRDFVKENNYSFYDLRQHTGWLRNIIVRKCETGELMVNIVLGFEAAEEQKKLFDFLLQKVPSITTLLYTINTKWNDTIYDLSPQVYFGKGYVMENLSTGFNGEVFKFKIGPKSFFQTNTRQAEKLYSITRDFAGLTGNEIVYDLYCGTGSIGIFVSKLAKKIIGVEAVAEAIEDAKENAALNNISHAEFFAGDVIKICDDEFFAKHGRPDVIITDPPRAGMHEKLVTKLLAIAAPKIVYVSCNTATQARDLALLNEKYAVEKIQPVDMFPHTHHIECVVLLKLKYPGLTACPALAGVSV
jgi:23S rRNA (uracil1939-C5)-methyltransferase